MLHARRLAFASLALVLIGFDGTARADEPAGAASAARAPEDDAAVTDASDDGSGADGEGDGDGSPAREYGAAHPHEQPGRAYHFFGAFYRQHFMPPRMLELFVEVAPSGISTPQMGLEYAYRRDHFEIIASLYYADFGMAGPFLGRNKPPTDLQWIDSELWAAMGSVTFLWSSHFSDWFAIEWGLGVGAGGVFGRLHRTEAYPTNDGAVACVPPTAAGQPGTERPDVPFSDAATVNGETVDQYCGTPGTFPTDPDGSTGEHYGVRARTWTQGGSVPNAWFRLAPQISLRFKLAHFLVLRVDGGFDFFSGPYVGSAVQIGF